jgi:hypothetical protein
MMTTFLALISAEPIDATATIEDFPCCGCPEGGACFGRALRGIVPATRFLDRQNHQLGAHYALRIFGSLLRDAARR